MCDEIVNTTKNISNNYADKNVPKTDKTSVLVTIYAC